MRKSQDMNRVPRIRESTLTEIRNLASREGRTTPEQIEYMLRSYVGQAKSDDAMLRDLLRKGGRK